MGNPVQPAPLDVPAVPEPPAAVPPVELPPELVPELPPESAPAAPEAPPPACPALPPVGIPVPPPNAVWPPALVVPAAVEVVPAITEPSPPLGSTISPPLPPKASDPPESPPGAPVTAVAHATAELKTTSAPRLCHFLLMTLHTDIATTQKKPSRTHSMSREPRLFFRRDRNAAAILHACMRAPASRG